MATEDFLPALDAATGHKHEVVHVHMGDDLRACSKCGKPVAVPAESDQATLCSTCFAVVVNNAGKPVDGGTKPLRLTASEVVEKDALEHRGTLLPVITHDALIKASERLAESLANDPEGSAMLYAQAKDHGLLVMVVVQAAIPRDQQKPATPARCRS